jgi:hypothetical protein
MKIELHRRNGEWSFWGLPIRKMKWSARCASWCKATGQISYRLTTCEGETLAEADTLRELRDDIADLIEDGKISRATCFLGVKVHRAMEAK